MYYDNTKAENDNLAQHLQLKFKKLNVIIEQHAQNMKGILPHKIERSFDDWRMQLTSGACD